MNTREDFQTAATIQATPIQAGSPSYRADLEEVGQGKFHIWGEGLDFVSNDPEREFCHRWSGIVTQDGKIEFYRAGILTLWFASLQRAARHKTEMGNAYPAVRKRRKFRPQTFMPK
jgi:hypothetical protein